MRVLIADDEPLVRSFIRSLIAEARPDIAVLEAADGRELVDAVLSGRVDAAFVDIRMPKLDGLAAVEAIRQAGAFFPWFVLSSHSDFGYAKRALELGALGYALKPPSPEEVRSALGLLASASEAERKKLAERFERDWALFVVGHAGAVPDLGRASRYSAALFVLDGEVGGDRREERAAAVVRALSERAGRYAAEGLFFAAQAWAPAGDIAAVVGIVDAKDGAAAVFRRFWAEAALAAEAENGLDGRVRALVLFADAGGDASSCREKLLAAREKAKRRALLPSGALELRRAEELLSAAGAGDIEKAERVSELVRCLRAGDLVGLKDAIPGYLAAGEGRRAASSLLERYLGADARTSSGPELFSACALRCGMPAGRQGDRDTIAAVEDYIRRRYAERIGVEQVAGVFGLSPNYLSSLFHKRVGSTFGQYLAEIRLLKAREFLREGLSVKEASHAVGYGSERHFTRLYRERFGYAPSAEKKNAAKS